MGFVFGDGFETELEKARALCTEMYESISDFDKCTELFTKAYDTNKQYTYNFVKNVKNKFSKDELEFFNEYIKERKGTEASNA